MTKADLVEQVAEKTGLTRTDVAAVVDHFLDAVKLSLEKKQNIEIRGFGTFKVKARKARKARNPRTGEEVPVPDATCRSSSPPMNSRLQSSSSSPSAKKESYALRPEEEEKKD